jgi:MOSC domain-containing protein
MMRCVTPSTGRVAWIAIAPVKSMALVQLDHAVLELTGIAGDRAFAMLDAQDRLVNGKRFGRLVTIRPDYDPGTGRLALRFPDGRTVAGAVELGEPTDGWFFGHPRAVRPVLGPWSEALSSLVGQPLRLVAPVDAGEGLDRGPSATLLSTAALAMVANAGGKSAPLDGRRFRMTFGIDGILAFAEDGWIGRDVRVGAALVRPAGNVGRCAVTTQDPETGIPSFDTLRVLQQTRGTLETTEPLPCGIWADIIKAGEVRLGDPTGPV